MSDIIRKLRRLVSTPTLLGREINRLVHRRFGVWEFNRRGTAIFDEDWDNLIILDACRFDMFRDRVDLDGRLESRLSRGSSTVEFLHGNLSGRSVQDTVYVTANPQISRFLPEHESSFHDIVHVWNGSRWDKNLGTVRPNAMADAAEEAETTYPAKRLLIHFVQPHYPFLHSSTIRDKGHFGRESAEKLNVWNTIKEKSVNDQERDAVIKAYHENLDVSLPAVSRLLTSLNGKTVVTSDHGNMLGERARPIPIHEWGHPRGIYTDELIKVPWLVSESKERKIWHSEESDTDRDDCDAETAEERLRDLGYL